ncbi:polyphenol oxidase family protein [Patescibacteria group bacterium]|nr:polyphenol oxidase family protein [Patescibacteria group bacterium]
MIASTPFHENLTISCRLSLTPPPEEQLQYMNQVHGDRVVIIDHYDPDHLPQADAMVTSLYGITLCVRVADCGNLYAYDPVAQLIGVAHSGWRGTQQNILGKMIDTMTSLGSQASAIRLRS